MQYLLFLTLLAATGDPKAPVWQTDYALALKVAKQSGKPIFAVFR